MVFLIEQLLKFVGIQLDPGVAMTLRILGIVSVTLVVLYYATMCRLYHKAGRPWWMALVPYLQYYVMADIATQKNIIWFLLAIFPPTSLISWAYMMFQLPKRFGKSNAFAVLNVVLGVFILPFVAFGSAEYLGDFERPKTQTTKKTEEKVEDITEA